MTTRCLALCVLTLIVSGRAWGGTGAYFDNPKGMPDDIQLKVSLDFTGPDPEDWKPLFKEASALLFDATERQVRISKVTFFVNCLEMKNQADVRIFTSDLSASTWPGRFGKEGYSIFLSQLHKSVSGADRGQFGLVHEIGHNVFGLLDEYVAKNGVSPASCVVSSPTTAASIMDGGTEVPIKNERTKFCTSANHNHGKTQQDSPRMIGSQTFTNVDSWTFLAAFVKDRYHATLDPPNDPPLSGTSGFKDPDFATGQCALDARVNLDSSGSMSSSPSARKRDTAGSLEPSVPMGRGGAIKAGKQGAATLIRLLHGNDNAGFLESHRPADRSLLRTMGIDNKFQLLDQIPKVRAGGSTGWTELLQKSFAEITAGTGGDQEPAPPKQEVIVLFSDGVQETEEEPSHDTASLLPAIKRRGAVVYTVAVGNGKAAGLRRAATETGGNFLFARNAAQADAAAMTLLAEIKSRGIIEAREGKLAPGQTIDVPVPVDTATQEAQLLLAWQDPNRQLLIQVRDPQDNLVTPEQADAIVSDGSQRTMAQYWLDEPEAGNWVVSITNPGPQARDYAFQAHSSAPEVTLAAHAENDVVELGAPLILKAGVATKGPVAHAHVVARIERPDGTTAEVELLDDGELAHRDERTHDGAYSNIFEDYQGSGTYNVEVTVDSAEGTTVAPDEEFNGSFEPQPVEPFIRKVRFSVVVQDAQQSEDVRQSENAVAVRRKR